MTNQQLVDYIKKESQRGVSMESTKNALLAIGWADQDIKKAYESLTTSVSSPKSSKKLIWILIILLLIIGGGIAAFMLYPSFVKTESSSTENMPTLPVAPIPDEIPPPTTPLNPAPAPEVSGVEKVTTIMADICQGYLTGNNSLIVAHASAQTVVLISNNILKPINSCVINKVYESDTNIVANLTLVPALSEKPSTNPPTTEDMVFIKEEGVWKFDSTASKKFTADQNKIKALTGDPNGFVDLMITGIVISPSRAVVNNKNLKVTVSVKNIGTKTSEEGTPLVASLLGFENGTTMVGGSYEPILAGGTTEWIFYPYKYNSALQVADTAGQKTIKIELNPDKKIIESNYENNIFTQAIQMYTK